jgi:hypothetical protein
MTKIEKIKSVSKKGKERLLSPTPTFVKWVQVIVVAIGTVPAYVESLPQNFLNSIPEVVIKYISYIAIIAFFALQIINKKTK